MTAVSKLILSPAFASWIVTILGVVGISDPDVQSAVKASIAPAVALVLAVWHWQHQKTKRNQTDRAAEVAKARTTVTAAPAAPMSGPALSGSGPGVVASGP